MKSKPLKAIKGKIQKQKIISFDTEDDSNGNVSLVSFFDGVTHTTFEIFDPKVDLEKALRFIYDTPGECIFVAHNLEYDLINLLREFDYIYVDEMNYTAKLITARLKKCPHLFIDSFNFFPGSLKNMAKLVNMEKGDYQEARLSREENIFYVQLDAKILWTFVTQFQDLINNELKISLRPTIGRMAMDTFRRNFLDTEYIRYNHPDCLKAYYGGRVEVFYKGDISGEIHSSDVNSMYPNAMVQDFPDTGDIKKGGLDKFKFGYGEFTIDVPETMLIPPLPYRFDKKLYFPTGEITGSWTYHEVRYALNLGCKLVKQHTGWGTNKKVRPFDKFVKYFFDKKAEAKADGRKFHETLYKLILNNCYGKLAQHSDRLCLSTNTIGPIELDILNAQIVRHFGNLFLYKYIATEPPDTANYLWGAYVTSYARTHLHALLEKTRIAGHTVLYCDTDSVMFLKNENEIPFQFSTELGGLSDDIYSRAEFHNAKGYILYDADGKPCKTASKGVPTKFAIEFFEQGKASFKKPVKLRESLAQDLKANVWKNVEKQMRTIYSKRSGETITSPWNVKKLPELDFKIKKKLQKDKT